MPLVMLKKTWPGSFRRNVRDADGKTLKTLDFVAGETIEVDASDCSAIASDIGKALQYCELRDGKLVVIEPDVMSFTPPPADSAMNALGAAESHDSKVSRKRK